ncbi:hypothetical protein COCNU_09G000160 [Cocos nucifera]|uniref:Uncharacterized protein n=1 Tax=Cocos nucifera TaxID=13894 RepID=A0A8K0IIJ4_COCNU|nr:hypothetical protein COCNU_09G000160 [Cocos nucifera]
MYDITMMHEGLTGFSRLSQSFKERAQTAEARAEVAEELLRRAEEQEAKEIKERAQLDAELIAIQGKVGELEAQLAKEKKTIIEYKKELNLCEPIHSTLEEKKIATEEKATAAKAAILDATT